MSDMAATIIPKSDQMNADDLIAGPITITVTGVTIRGGQEQPISIHYEGDKGKPYKACKSMCRILVAAWGPDSKKYVGRSLTLYRDPTVKWAGLDVGGIRISHMSDIDSSLTMALTMTKSNRKPYTVKPLEKNAAPPPLTSNAGNPAGGEAGAATITADEALALEARCTENSINVANLKKAAKVERLSLIKPDELPRAHQWIDAVLAKRASDAADKERK